MIFTTYTDEYEKNNFTFEDISLLHNKKLFNRTIVLQYSKKI